VPLELAGVAADPTSVPPTEAQGIVAARAFEQPHDPCATHPPTQHPSTTLTPTATSVPPISVLPDTGEGVPRTAPMSTIVLLLGGGALLMTGALLWLRSGLAQPGRDRR
jgi:hypothetical protein